jgi:phenylacetate-CoA ligase
MLNEETLYRRSPAWLQTVFLNAHAVRIQRERYGPVFDELERAWIESERWEPARLREQQDQRVRDIVRLAAERVPFYGRRFAEHGVVVSQVQGVADLPKLPILTKEDVRGAGDDLRAAGSGALVHGHTSGTTGTPLGLWYDRDMSIANNAADWRQKRWGGMTRADWCGMFLGRVVVPTQVKRPPFWRANRVHRQLWFSSFHMDEANLDLYVAEIRRRGLQFLEGYPSTLFIVARHVLRRGERLPMRAVFSSSETLHDVQREVIGEAFQCPLFDFYGLAERTIFAGECEAHDGKHLFDEYGVTELVDDAGQPVADGETGWLTGTSLWNRGMPMIRYRTGDLSKRRTERCACGRGLGRIAGVATKAEDIVVTPDGRFISPSVLTHPFKPFDQLRKSQVIQDAPDHVLVKLVAGSTFTDAHRAALLAGLRERLGAAMRVDVEVVDDIPPERSGKFRWVISKVPHGCALDWTA